MADWAREKVKSSNLVTPKNVKPLNLLITGSASVGKSRLIETCHGFLTKTFHSYTSCQEKVKSSFTGTDRDLCYQYFSKKYQFRPAYPYKN